MQATAMPNNPKNVRKCSACKEHADKSDLIRVVKNSDGVFVDVSGKADGRGAYIHKTKRCVELAKKRKVLNYAFKTAVSDEVYDALDSQLED